MRPSCEKRIFPAAPAPSRRQGVNVKTRPLDFERAAACDSHTAALRQAYHAPASFARSTGMRKSVAQPQRGQRSFAPVSSCHASWSSLAFPRGYGIAVL